MVRIARGHTGANGAVQAANIAFVARDGAWVWLLDPSAAAPPANPAAPAPPPSEPAPTGGTG
jgi:hypothetical protein